jgi:hypothetical protein
VTDRRAVVLVAAVLALCGCADAGQGPPVGREPLPQQSLQPPTPGAEQTFEVLPPPPLVTTWSDDGDLAVTTHGSSSCPSGPIAVTVVGEQEVAVEIGLLFPDRDPCTADMSPTTTEVERPRGIDPGETVTVRLRSSGGAEETVVLPPAGDEHGGRQGPIPPSDRSPPHAAVPARRRWRPAAGPHR